MIDFLNNHNNVRKKMAIALLCSGGDAPGMNPAIKAFVELCSEYKKEAYLIYDGLEGLIDNCIKKADHRMVAGILLRGGTIIGSSRSQRFFEYEWRKKAYENLQEHGITHLMVLGGDGSFKALHTFYHDFHIPFIGIPTTIDNDIYGTEYCLGVDTALNAIRSAIDDIRDTISSFRRACVIETMGRDCGYLALVSAISSGAEICLIPEASYDLDALKRRLLVEVQEGRRYLIAIVAEGLHISHEIMQWCEHELGFETRLSVLGHIQRGGSPTVQDRLMAYQFVAKGLFALMSDPECHYVTVLQKNYITLLPIDTIVGKHQPLPEFLLELSKPLRGINPYEGQL